MGSIATDLYVTVLHLSHLEAAYNETMNQLQARIGTNLTI